MDESTTTDSTVDTGVTDDTTSTDSTTDSAVSTDESTTTTEDTQAGADDGDDNLAWLQKKGIDPSDPEAMAKVAKMYREAEKTMHQSTAKASELQQALAQPQEATGTEGDDNPVVALAQEVQGLKLTQNVNNFWATNPDAKQYEGAMAKIVTDNPTVGALVKAGYLSVENLYQMAKGSDGSREAALRKEGGREALERVADKQQGRAVQGHATSSDLGSSQKKDPFREALLGNL